MLKGCLKSLAILAGLIAGYYYVLHGRITPPGDRWGALALGFGMWIVSGLLWNVLNALSNRRALKRASSTAQQFEDGQIVAVAGVIRPLGAPLLAPFSKRPCVAYEYWMRPLYSRSSGQTPPQVSGEALAPSVIEGPTSRAQLLAWPFLQNYVEAQFDGDEHRQNARAYVAATQFETATVSSAFSKLKEMLADDDGSIKVDMNNGGEIDVDGLRLCEKIVPAGANVCAIGTWSAQKNGIVPDPNSTAGVELIPGTLDTVLRKLRGKAIGFFIGAIVMATVFNAIGYFVLTNFENQERPGRLTQFHQTVMSDDREAVEKALSKGAKNFVDASDSQGMTALMVVKSAAVAQLLLDHGATGTRRDPYGRPPLIYAAIRGDAATLKVLLDHGADIDAQDNDGLSALMFAISAETPEALRFLIVRKANLELVDETGRSAIEIAENFPDIRQILLDAGATDETLDAATAPRLPEDCGEPMRVVEGYLAAVAAGDVTGTSEAMTSRMKMRYTREQLEELAAARPAEARFTPGWASATLATLEPAGKTREYAHTGTARPPAARLRGRAETSATTSK